MLHRCLDTMHSGEPLSLELINFVTKRGEPLSLLSREAEMIFLDLMKLPSNRAGLMKLRQEITTCEYEDVHMMWELIKRKEEDSVVGQYSKLPKFW